MRIRFLMGVISLGLVSVSASPVVAQLGGLGRIARDVAAPRLPNLLGGAQPVSTNIRDAVNSDPSRDSWRAPAAARPLTSLPRTATGGFTLAGGYYRMDTQSYCLHAGTYGPGGGDGYLYAPLKGSAQDAVASILRNSVAKPQIAQRDIQMLLWAIVARAKFEDLNTDLKRVASELLTPRQIASLNRSAMSALTSSQFQSVIGGVPEPLRTVLEAEQRMRGMLSGPSLAYGEMERVAVIGGIAPRGEGSIETPASRWNLHPDGYWIRYTPSGYSHTVTEIWVEPGSGAVGRVYEPSVQVAVPGNTSRQRLAQSGREYVR